MTLGGEAGALVGGEALMLVLMPAEPGARALRSKSPCGYRIAFLAGSSRTSLSLFFWKKLLVWPQQRRSRWTAFKPNAKVDHRNRFPQTFLFSNGRQFERDSACRPLGGKTVIRAAPAERRCRNAGMVDRRRWC